MRLTSITAAFALATISVGAPVFSLQAEAKPVTPTTHQLAIPAVPASAAPSPSASSSSGSSTADEHAHDSGREVAHLPAQPVKDFDVLGVTFSGAAPKGMEVQARVRHDGTWSGWQHLEVATDGPDAQTAEGKRAVKATSPMTAAASDGVEIKVLTADGSTPKDLKVSMIDGGSSAADGNTTPAASAGAIVNRPSIRTRAEWGADESMKPCAVDYTDGFQGAAVHHTVNSNSYSQADVPGLIRGIYAYHTQTQKWCDIGYNFIVDRYGTIWEGRTGSITKYPIGAHAQGFNSQTVGISTLGDFGSAYMPSATVSSVAKVVAWQGALGRWDPRQTGTYTSYGNPGYPAGTVITRYRTMGHRDLYPTSCPGDAGYTQVPTIRSQAGSIWQAGGGVAFASLTPSTVTETYYRPNGTTVNLSGRGYGHGRGMSQWGAYGAAVKGLYATQIGSFYYPGTSSAYTSTSTLRVRLGALGTGGTTIKGGPGLYMYYGSSTPKQLATQDGYGRPITAWRVVPDGTGLTLQWQVNGTWTSSAYWTKWTQPITFTRGSVGSVQVILPGTSTVREYAGNVTTRASGSSTFAVNNVGLEEYLKGVVPAEMPASWPLVALQAQAIAARTYALYGKAHSGSAYYDTCDSTACQVYNGRADRTLSGALITQREQASSSKAVTTSARMIRTYGGAPALTEFSSSNGGVTAKSSLPYQVVKADPYDGVVTSGNPRLWSVNIPITTLQAKFPSVGTFRAIQVIGRVGAGTWGGRTTTVRVVGDSNVQTMTGPAFRMALGLRSEWFVQSNAPATQAATFPKDLSNDRIPDLFGVAGDYSRVYRGTSAPGVTANPAMPGWGGMSLLTQVGPWDTDNRGDLLARSSDGQLWAYRGGNQTMNQGRTLVSANFGGYTAIAATGDFDGDRYTDFVARNSAGDMILFSGNGSGGVKSTRKIAGGWNTFTRVFSAGDLNGDGRSDIVGVYASNGSMRIYPGTGTGSLGTSFMATGFSPFANSPMLLGVGDRTGDGRHDLLGKRNDGYLVVYPVTGNGVIGSPAVLGSGYTSTIFAR